MSNDSIDNLARLLAETVPQGLRSVRDDLENNFRSVLQSGLTKLDLVTREEFAVQEAVLARTREKLDALEQKLAELANTPVAKKAAKKKAAKKTASKKKASKKKTT
jgi:BMFP domain-containing protein YqiC